MKCAECQKLGKTSKVYIDQMYTTMMGYTPYYDEGGKYHNNNPNTITKVYHCSNGHTWKEKSSVNKQ